MSQARRARLSSYEQQRLYEAVCDFVNGKHASRIECILGAIADVVLYPSRIKATGKVMPDDIRAIEQGMEFKHEYARAKQAYLSLKTRKLILLERRGKEVSIKLSHKGYMRLTKSVMRNTKQRLPSGEKLFVAFDIPEDVSHVRYVLRRFLKSVDFKLVQKSIWETDREIEKPLKELIDSLNVSRWVTVIRGRELKDNVKNARPGQK